jgi:NAD(P)-dependent dehydrogenase (short-subunit alcohol dehydrogenase family)
MAGALLQGRAVVITGAGRGLGRAYALDAAAHGARVVVNDVDSGHAATVVDEIDGAGGVALASGHDISDPDEAQALIDACVERFGRIDGLVNNAGLYHETPLWDEDPARVRRVVEVNVLGTASCTIAAARAMRDGGAIVNASSGGLYGFPTTATYGMTKGAVAALTFAAALDLEERGIRVNAISPKALTRLTENALGRHTAPLGGDEAPLADIEQRRPERIAPLVTFLLSDLSAGISGQFLRFDGERIAVVPTTGFADHPSAFAAAWDPPAIADAFAGELGPALQPYGVERRLPLIRRAAAGRPSPQPAS